MKVYTNYLVLRFYYQQIDEIIGCLFTALKDMFSSISLSLYYSFDDIIRMQIELAFNLREMFKCFSNHASNYFDSIVKSLLLKTKMIIKADYIHFCFNDVTEKRNII